MTPLLWKLLSKHISIQQLTGFAIANLIGMFIILLSTQLYQDIAPIFAANDNPFNKEYLVVSKRFTTARSLLGQADKDAFTMEEIREMEKQDFVESVAPFITSSYQVGCYISIEGIPSMGTDMFFESVPDKYVDVDPSLWKWSEDDEELPIVLPRSYLAVYNFGFAKTRSLPKLDERTISKIGLTLLLKGNGLNERMKGRVVGFTNRLNTVLVPQSFLVWSNARYASSLLLEPTRLIVETPNPTDEKIVRFMSEHDYEIDNNMLNQSKATYILRIIFSAILFVGVLISALSFYVLTLSIYLLVTKNAYKIQNLLLLGYSASIVAIPYQLLAGGLNLMIFVLSFVLMLIARSEYMKLLWDVFPSLTPATLSITMIVAVSLLSAITVINSIIISHRIKRNQHGVIN